MSCDAVQKLIPLYYYGELTPDEEDVVEAHVFECAACARETERQRTLAAALDRRQLEPPPPLAAECRAGLMLALQGRTPVPSQMRGKSPWMLFLDAMADTFRNWHRFRQPLAAAALVALGFFAARVPGWRGSSVLPTSSFASLSPESFATVRSVQTDNSGRVQISFDETQRRVISGRMDDTNIRRLLVAGVNEENPDIRLQSVDLLKARAAIAPDVREALLNRLVNDPNPGVRQKAIEGLKPLAGDPAVRKTLAQVLLTDNDPMVRMDAVKLLIEHRDDSIVGVLQSAVQREDNTYVRSQCEKALKEANASIGTF
ncbi:MAG TPA: HEAT repeat domain-containing protein [Bryobacteraceae bacterium]|nr:HEAT repeat domain-containing protein [Bryobacteraceae bacterium]